MLLTAVLLGAALHVQAPNPGLAGAQRVLARLHFDPGPADGLPSEQTTQALWAFQSLNGLRLGPLNARTLRALRHPHRITPLVAGAAGNRAEVRLGRQVLVIWRGGRVAYVSHISTGSGRHYTEHGHRRLARTPRGNFHIFRKINGWHTGPLGAMYRPSYFSGPVAIHGSVSVPRHPASHGCVRVSLTQADAVYRLLPRGLPVYVR